MKEEFGLFLQSPGVKRFKITDEGFFYGRQKISYSSMTPISITSCPSRMWNGIASSASFNQPLSLTYSYKDRDRAAYAFQWANDRIEFNGKKPPFLFRFMGFTGTTMEVYEDHLLIKFMEASGLANLRNGNKPSVKKINFSDIQDLQLREPEKKIPGFLRVLHKKNVTDEMPELIHDPSAVPVSTYTLDTAREVVAFIQQARQPKELPPETAESTENNK